MCSYALEDHVMDILASVLDFCLIPSVSLPHDMVSQSIKTLLDGMSKVPASIAVTSAH